jgi:6-phosphogluconolactonase/glucosamine-6-phosphate isomerase/deaminase
MIKSIKKRVEELSKAKNTTLMKYNISVSGGDLISKLSEMNREIKELEKQYNFQLCEYCVEDERKICFSLQLKFSNFDHDIR